jgi:Alpha-L-arabinofuranosidase B, catalytic
VFVGCNGARQSRLPLDGVPTPIGAWSVYYRLRSAYTGSLLRIRRSNDNAEADIGYGSDNLVDQAAITTHCGANSGFVTKVYDQSGNGRDVSQATTTAQPSIVNAGTIRTSNGQVIALFDGGDDVLARSDSCGLTGDPTITFLMVFQSVVTPGGLAVAMDVGNASGKQLAIGWNDSTSLKWLSQSGSALFPISQTVPNLTRNIVRHTSGANFSAVTWRQNGNNLTLSSSVNVTINIDNLNTSIGGLPAIPSFANINWNTSAIWNANLSTDEVARIEHKMPMKIVETLTSGTSWTVPDRIQANGGILWTECWGGGGNGGTRTTNGGGGGGGGGAYAASRVNVASGTTSVSYAIGAAAGDTNWNSSAILAKGGVSTANDTTTGSSGGLASGCTGDVKKDGGSGANAPSGTDGGGGGGSGGSAANGNAGSGSTGATRVTDGSNGGNGKTGAQGAGSQATDTFSGGGGGGKRSSSGTQSGGAGRAGRIRLTYTLS